MKVDSTAGQKGNAVVRDARDVGAALHECGGTFEPQSARWTLRDDVSRQILAESGPYAPGGLLVR